MGFICMRSLHVRKRFLQKRQDALKLLPPQHQQARIFHGDHVRGARLVLTGAWSNTRQVAQVAEQAQGRVVELPLSVTNAKSNDMWIGMMDRIHAKLLEALDSLPRGP